MNSENVQVPKDQPCFLSLWKVVKLPIALPAVQRGAVWRPRQVEELWDSLLRGFPIGSLLLAPFDPKRGTRRIENVQNSANPKYHLLDGHQRLNAISLAFLNILNILERPEARSALWIDLEEPGGGDERRFIFRVVTASHPWGYRRENPRDRLEAHQRRAAGEAYKNACRNINGLDFRPGKLPLSHAWPWDAKLPVPFSFVVVAVKEGLDKGLNDGAIWHVVQQYLERLPYWSASRLPTKFGKDWDWKKAVLDLLQNPSEEFLSKIIASTREALLSCIPVQYLPNEKGTESQEPELQQGPAIADERDPFETLFVRVNSAGTPLEGEELRYSILKAAYPEVDNVVDLLKTRLMSPARLVTLISRLVLARQANDKERTVPPREPGVAAFRRLVRTEEFSKGILECLGLNEAGQPIVDENGRPKGQAGKLLERARGLLVEKEWGLPPVLAADLARNSPDAFFLLLAWIDRMEKFGRDPEAISDEDKRRLIGTITTLGWFTKRPFDCLKALWNHLYNTRDPQQFFAAHAHVLSACSEELLLIPPLPPDHLQEVVNTWIPKDQGFDDPTNKIVWNTGPWEWWNFEIPGKAKRWFSEYHVNESEWQGLVNKLLDMRSLVVYAQRVHMKLWYDFDPASPDQLEDTDRPWDFDHIHPSEYVSRVRDMSGIIKAWHGSIGNLRTWPLEVNRGQQDISPGEKLGKLIEAEKVPPYNLKTVQELRKASFVTEDNWPHWQASTPGGKKPEQNKYLAKPPGPDDGCRPALIRAITSRWIALYREWYEQLRIETLFKPPSTV